MGVLPEEHQITSGSGPSPRHWSYFKGKPGHAQRLVDVPLGILVGAYDAWRE
jgi:hypothetical protein